VAKSCNEKRINRNSKKTRPYQVFPLEAFAPKHKRIQGEKESFVILSAAKDLGEPRDVSRSSRHNNRAFGSLPYSFAQ
jgi:hypothetical protein